MSYSQMFQYSYRGNRENNREWTSIAFVVYILSNYLSVQGFENDYRKWLSSVASQANCWLNWCDSLVHPMRAGTRFESFLSAFLSTRSCRLTSKHVWLDLIRSKNVTLLWLVSTPGDEKLWELVSASTIDFYYIYMIKIFNFLKLFSYVTKDWLKNVQLILMLHVTTL